MTLRPFGSVSSVKSIRSSGLPPCIVLLFAACAPAVPAAAHNRETATKRSLIQPPKNLVPGGWTGAAGVGQARYERGQEPERLVRSGEWGVGMRGSWPRHSPLPTPHSALLFVPQRLNRIQVGGPSRWPYPEQDPNKSGEEEGQQYGRRRYGSVEVSELGQRDRPGPAEDDPADTAKQAQYHRLDEELQQDVPRRRAQRLSNPYLTRPLRHRHQHDVHDADAADKEADGRDSGEQKRENLGRLSEGVEEIRLTPDLEVVVATGQQTVLPPQHFLDLCHGVGDRRLARRDHTDLADAIRSEDAELRRTERNQHLIVGIAEAAGRPLRRQNPDHLELDSTNSHVLPNQIARVGDAEVVDYRRAHNGDSSALLVIDLGEHLPGSEVVLSHFEVIRCRAEYLGVGVGGEVLYLEVARHLGLHRCYQRTVCFLERTRVGNRERCTVGLGGDACANDLARHHREKRRTERRDPRVNRLLSAASESDDGDDRADSDDHAQHREE